jgi:hypothetical protein
MPVDCYLLPLSATETYGFDIGLYAAASRAATKYDDMGFVHLYLTGLTIAALGAVDGFRKVKVKLILFTWDREEQIYVPITI